MSAAKCQNCLEWPVGSGGYLCNKCSADVALALSEKNEEAPGALGEFDDMKPEEPKPKTEKDEITEALTEQGYYNPFDVFHHAPEFHKSNDERYAHEIHIVKWNTKSVRMTVFLARKDEKKNRWVFAKQTGVKRYGHGENMRSRSTKI